MGSSSMESYTAEEMQPLKAHVRNGHLVVDELAELPEGQVFYLVPVQDDEFEDEELRRELQAAGEEIDAGLLVDGETVMATLRARS